MKNKEIKGEYCKEFGYGSFNKHNENDYSKWLEQQLLIQRVSQQRELLNGFFDWYMNTYADYDFSNINLNYDIDDYLKTI